MGNTVPPKIFPGPSAIGGSQGSNVVMPAGQMPGASGLGASVNTVNQAPVLPPAPKPIPHAPIPRSPLRIPAQLPGRIGALYGGPLPNARTSFYGNPARGRVLY